MSQEVTKKQILTACIVGAAACVCAFQFGVCRGQEYATQKSSVSQNYGESHSYGTSYSTSGGSTTVGYSGRSIGNSNTVGRSNNVGYSESQGTSYSSSRNETRSGQSHGQGTSYSSNHNEGISESHGESHAYGFGIEGESYGSQGSLPQKDTSCQTIGLINYDSIITKHPNIKKAQEEMQARMKENDKDVSDIPEADRGQALNEKNQAAMQEMFDTYITPAKEEVDVAIDRVIARKGISVVLNSQVATRGGEDITNDVLAEIGIPVEP